MGSAMRPRTRMSRAALLITVLLCSVSSAAAQTIERTLTDDPLSERREAIAEELYPSVPGGAARAAAEAVLAVPGDVSDEAVAELVSSLRGAALPPDLEVLPLDAAATDRARTQWGGLRVPLP